MVQINTVVVIGAGGAGRRIAQAAALAGLRTILVDILPGSLRQAQSEMQDRLQQAQSAGHLSAVGAYTAMRRLEFMGTISEAAREADLVIEAVPDEMESKIEIFTLLDKICRPQTILASTTSSLSLTEIASVTYRREMILGMRFHFAGPGGESAILEIVRAAETGEEAWQLCAAAGQRMGMKPEIITETPTASS